MTARGFVTKTAMQDHRPLGNRSERRLRRRNLVMGEASEGAVEAPSDV